MKHLLISRTDNIGDVILTLPLAGVLKELFPDSKITFLGKTYTESIVNASCFVDKFLNWDTILKLSLHDQIALFAQLKADIIIHVFPNSKVAKLAQLAKIPTRIGTRNRFFHWWTCNKRIPLSRKNSDLHEAQLNLKMIECLGAKSSYSLSEIEKYYGLTKISPSEKGKKILSETQFNLILHPKSKGSAREWGLDNFAKLIEILPQERFKIFVTGTIDEGNQIRQFLDAQKDRITDLTGKFTLSELISFINQADGLVAASTGVLHIAAALGKIAIGLYAPMRPIFPQRWSPIGRNASFLVLDKNCEKCRKTSDCECIRSITPQQVKEKLENSSID